MGAAPSGGRRTGTHFATEIDVMSEPLVSVKMLTYNHAPYIAQAIEGVLMQKTTFPFELVIGEDCSTDGTREIVFDYAKRYPDVIRVLTSEQNVGANENGTRVNAVLRGKYIAWCEGDDYWHRDDKLQMQVDYLESHPDCGLVCSDYDVYNTEIMCCIQNHGRLTGKTSIENPKIEDILSGRVCVRTVTAIAQMDLVKLVRESDPYLHLEGRFKMGDLQLWAELAVQSKIHIIQKSLATYQLLEESATRSRDSVRKLSFWLSAAELHLYLCDKYKMPDSIHKEHERNWRRHSLKLAFLEKKPEMAADVKTKFPHLTFSERVWYLGATQSAFRPLLGLALLLRRAMQSGGRGGK